MPLIQQSPALKESQKRIQKLFNEERNGGKKVNYVSLPNAHQQIVNLLLTHNEQEPQGILMRDTM